MKSKASYLGTATPSSKKVAPFAACLASCVVAFRVSSPPAVIIAALETFVTKALAPDVANPVSVAPPNSTQFQPAFHDW
jgi:hypothetical protein